MVIRHGGDGFQATEDIRHAAYVASILQCAPSMHAYLPNGHQRQPTTTPSLAEFCDSVNLLRAHGVSCLTNVHFANAKMQRSISQELQQRRQQREIESIPDLPPVHGPAIHQLLSPDDAAIRRQGLTNCRCPESGSWLLANPALWINALSDVAFRMALWLRCEHVGGASVATVDCLGDHTALCCPQIVPCCLISPAPMPPPLANLISTGTSIDDPLPNLLWNAPDRIERRADLILLSNAVEITPSLSASRWRRTTPSKLVQNTFRGVQRKQDIVRKKHPMRGTTALLLTISDLFSLPSRHQVPFTTPLDSSSTTYFPLPTVLFSTCFKAYP